jgi:hypothetical protein
MTIGRELLVRAVQKCKAANSDFIELTVNASPNAVSAYHGLGFLLKISPAFSNHSMAFSKFLILALQPSAEKTNFLFSFAN